MEYTIIGFIFGIFLATVMAFRGGEYPGWTFLICLFSGIFMTWYTWDNPENVKEREETRAVREADKVRRQTPHVIREADGCKVYAFESSSGNWHYFTRCPNSSTTTTSPYQVCRGSGKTHKCETKYEDIETK